ncbi:MAG: UPF0280 family protein [Paracoccaceae bacterium]
MAALLPGNRLHLQHGPMDLIIGAEGARAAAFEAARARFETVLDELVGELELLRTQMLPGTPIPKGAIALRMHTACRPHRQTFLTPMAAVAGSVADTVLDYIINAAPLHRAYVNNGGDIAVYMEKNQGFTTAIQNHAGKELGRITLNSEDYIGGIATSGRHGRSHSLGIADSVTVLAETAAQADVAATLIANAVDLPGHSAITRTPANALAPESDLGEARVVTHVAPLTPEETNRALQSGLVCANTLRASGHIKAAALFLCDEVRVFGHGFTTTKRALERT